jgi:hypothetical protein
MTAAPGFMLSFGRTRVWMASDANITLSSGYPHAAPCSKPDLYIAGHG